ncbi:MULTISPECIES: IS110 family transposase [Bacillus cereus group]|uniref:IS110 family transposase n=1 Tax=Bacillus TaxID=1386 RepID=UPI0001A1C7F1|nr:MULTISPECIES: IS110 family transposase [Bacillus cereus group]EEM68342.1 Transposase IS116/IS110/IS902 [Bacillus thuringiensis serovar andalousiensis BGSC 4AW1]MEB9631870.1 IS110 family transposase [Bacillus anthracis]OUB01726.1 IS110 family transposase [Bacillus thuringiensis serovar oswaldocruzi]OUB02671.1 IS110 family transposase [Bacillus thuringiensis serovar oswaldocruzi]OUB02678.1 IS110 family transposase [Bacillus thuringiensis serovar oswaldocruzi]
MKHVIAFDISMGKSYMVIYNAQKQCVFESEIKHSKPEFKKLQEKIHELTDKTGELPKIVFEATGIYSRQLERFMQDNQFTYCLLNPLEAKLQCDFLRIHKTDRSDAHRLALTHFTAIRRVFTGTDNLFYQLKSFSRLYSELDSELSIIRGRMHKVIQLTFPELERMFTSKSDLFLNFVQLFPHPDCILGLSKTIIKNRIRANANKKISNITAEKKAIQILEIAKTSYPAVSQNDVLCDQLKLYARRYQELLHQKECCINKMVYIAEQRAEYNIILSLPGIGPNTAVRLMAEIGDITRFNNNKHLNAFAGIDIRRFQSGKTFFKDKINKRGNKHLRKLLFLIIQNMIKQRRYGQNHIVEYYDKLKTQPYNKCHKVASIACVNKFLKLLFHLITHDIHYDYRLTA